MSQRTVSHEESLAERLKDPDYAVMYLQAALEEKDEHTHQVFLLALRDVAKAQGVIGQ